MFSQVVGQTDIKERLLQEAQAGRVPHALLLSGPSGCGKLALAVSYAQYLLCHRPGTHDACGECPSCRTFTHFVHPDLHFVFPIIKYKTAESSVCDVYLDAWRKRLQAGLYFDLNDWLGDMKAENQQALIYAAEAAQIQRKLALKSTLGGRKAMIVWMPEKMNAECANKLLKLIEEPPEQTNFLLVSDEPEKILPTILSRCQIYDFSRISINDMVEHLEHVAAQEGIEAEPEALNVIAQKADGGMRDALSIFDQVVSFTNGHITYQGVINNLNVLDYEYYFRLTDCFLQNKVQDCLLIFNEVLHKGFDGNHFITGLSSHFRDLLVSRDPSTLCLLEVGASIRERYQTQARQCTPTFLYKAMKLCNDCDLNYRVSKNKRLLIELTLIQLAQLTAGDDPVGGQGPSKQLKPTFTNQPAAPAQPTAPTTGTTQVQESAPAYTPQPQPAAPQASASQTAPAPGNRPAVHANPLPQTQGEKKIPVVKAGSYSVSIRRPQKQETAPQPVQQAQTTAASTTWEDHIFNEKDLNYYWREFAARLPKEEAANAGRMMNMQPHLLKDQRTFEVVVDNEMVQKYMEQLAPQIVGHLCQQLHNRTIRMTVRVSQENENVRAYSHVERFKMMSQKNPKLLKLKETFGLELN